MTQEKISDGLDFLCGDKRIGIIYGVLKRLHIDPWQADYEDLFQEGCLAFAAAFAAFPGDPSTATNFPAYAYQRVYWRLLDLLRRSSRASSRSAYSLDDQTDAAPDCQRELGAADDRLDHACNRSWLTKLADQCTPGQRRYLYACLALDLSGREIADYYGVSPSAVHQWKRGVIEKARRLGYN